MLYLPAESSGLYIQSTLCEGEKKKLDLPVWCQQKSFEELFLGLTAQLNTKVEDFFTTETFSVTLQNPFTKDVHATKFLFKVLSLL